MEGTTWVIHGVTGDRLIVEPGDKLVIPAGVLHIEGEDERAVTYVMAIPTTKAHSQIFGTIPADDPRRPTA